MSKIFKLISVDKKEQKYLKQFKSISLEKLSLEQGNQFFIKIIQDFKDYKLNPDEVSVFGSKIFHAIGKKHKGTDLFFTSLAVSELSFMIRNNVTYQNISNCLKEIDTFFNKYSINK